MPHTYMRTLPGSIGENGCFSRASVLYIFRSLMGSYRLRHRSIARCSTHTRTRITFGCAMLVQQDRQNSFVVLSLIKCCFSPQYIIAQMRNRITYLKEFYASISSFVAPQVHMCLCFDVRRCNPGRQPG